MFCLWVLKVIHVNNENVTFEYLWYLLYIHLLLHSLENRVNLLFFVAEERVEPPGVVRVIEHKLQTRRSILGVTHQMGHKKIQ